VDLRSTMHSTFTCLYRQHVFRSPKTLAFIKDYRSFTALWDMNHKDFTNKIKRNDALNVLVTNYKMSVKEVKNCKGAPKSDRKKKWCGCR
jgi:hypothetical protein